MAAIFKGAFGISGHILSSISYSYEPNNGESIRLEYNGTESGMRTILGQFRTGYPDSRSESFKAEGGLWKAVVYLPFWALSDQAAQVEWTTSTEMVEKDIFTHPTIVADMVDKEGVDEAATYRKDVEDAVSKGEGAASGGLWSGVQSQVYTELSRGVTGYEDEYQIITRTRRAHARYNFGYTVQLGLGKYVWKTGQLRLPSNLRFNFASLPPPPVQTISGWRLRDQQFSIVGNKMEETVSFALSNWSELLYVAAPDSAFF